MLGEELVLPGCGNEGEFIQVKQTLWLFGYLSSSLLLCSRGF